MPSLPRHKWSSLVIEHAPSEQAGTLARLYGPLVFKAAYRVLGDASQAEDVQQTVFLRLLETQPSKVDSWPAYLTASAVRGAIDLLRRQQRWWRILPLWDSQEPATEESPEHIGIEHERGKRLRKALAKLPRREAQCFSLRHLEGMEISEIAIATELSENNVHVTLHRARRRLEECLGDKTMEHKA
jgi:RNA polymerase sigma factor (sigma-70 family)